MTTAIDTKRVLVVGAGGTRPMVPGYDTKTLDIDPSNDPDILGDMCAIPAADESFDALVARHCLEHVSYPRGQVAMAEWYRVLKPWGRVHVAVPDVLEVVRGCRSLADKVYDSPAGPIHVCEMMYGFKTMGGSRPSMRHWAAYDEHMLEKLVTDAGFTDVQVRQANYEITVEAVKPCNATTN